MPQIEIYTTPICPYCARAKALLDEKNADYTEYDVMTDASMRNAMSVRAKGATSVPQIFFDGKHIGGCDALMALEADAALDPMLGR